MPELPEVEVVRRGLEPLISARTITRVRVIDPRSVKRHLAGASDFEHQLVGRRFAEPRRRGKYLWFPFSDGDAVLAHLGMSGQFRVDHLDAGLVANTRILIDMDDGNQLRFIDQRLFGGLSLSAGGALLPPQIAHIAPDPFDPDFDLVATATTMQHRRSTVKRALLDQSLVSGIGNIYADEALWLSHTWFDQPTETLSTRRARSVLRASRQVMEAALAEGGTSFDALYVHVNGESGYFGRALNVYGRSGLPCPRCGTTIVREHFMNRSSYRCPRCQRRVGHTNKVGYIP